ncbi:hypothetical protein [Endozoicomonas sp. 8E]|uniref:hypothetical protein n=1 Tax=Endozoicomonas sp. 8E TaxID=3035692 RepID=UPI0029393568|nr:hypothetical protein [Endozoicomonas sp. 8E]WOG26890.1 hypothetical protein P6910_20430 [Endozoicomonas sp. 8E]
MELFLQETKTFIHWLDQGTASLMPGGQISTGKTILINKVLNSRDNFTDTCPHFDFGITNPKQGEFFAIALARIIRTALKVEVHSFHLQYQFYPIPKARKTEKQKLKELNYRTLQSKSRSIDIKTLMEIPETD